MNRKKSLITFIAIILIGFSNFIWAGKEKAPELKLKLIWKLRFDSLPANEESIFGRPKKITPEMLPRMIETEDKLIFFDEQGKIKKTFDIDRRRFDGVSISKHGDYIALRKTVGEIPSTDVPTPAKVQVFDKEGNLVYEISGCNASNSWEVSDKGGCLVVDGIYCTFTLYNSAGNKICHKKTFEKTWIGHETVFYGSFSGDGEKFVIFATDFIYREESKAYLILYDISGEEIWRKQVEEGYISTGYFDISETGDRIIVSLMNEADPGITKVVLYDGTGNIIKEFPGIWPLSWHTAFDTNQNVFVLNNSLSAINYIYPDGEHTQINLVPQETPTEDKPEIKDSAISASYIAFVSMESKGNRVILNIFNRNGELLLERNLGGNKNDLKKTYVDFAADDIISVKFADEVRYYKISAIGK